MLRSVRPTIVSLLVSLLVLAAAPLAVPAQSGADKAAPCAACHGPAGNSANPQWPNLAGQHSSYTVRQLQAFQSGARRNELMSGMAAGLSEQDMQDLGAWYAGQEPRIGSADPALVELGAAIYRGGNPDSGVPACMACHGPRGSGNPGAAYPALSGQHAVYTASQLQAYKSGERASDEGAVMRTIAARMTTEEIEAVASYTEGLH